MKKILATFGVLAILVGGAAFAFWLWPTDFQPEAPPAVDPPASFTSVTSRIAIPIEIPSTLIREKLEQAIPREFPFDVTDDARAYGKPVRGPITVRIDTQAKNMTASTTVSGKVRVENKGAGKASVEIDVAGTIAATAAPELRTGRWTLDPRLTFTTKLNRAVAKTPLGDFDVTKLIEAEIARHAEKGRLQAVAELEKVFDSQDKVERAWNKLNDIVRLSEQPATWLRVTPRQVEAAPPAYVDDVIKPRLLLECETQVFVGPDKPAVPDAKIEPLRAVEVLPDESELRVPIALPYAVINAELKRRFTEAEIRVSEKIYVIVDDAKVDAYGEGIMLTVKFRARRGSWTAAAGTLHISGRSQYDPALAQLRFVDLDYSTQTRNLLLKSAVWMYHSKLLERLNAAAVLNLADELEKAKATANERLKHLTTHFEDLRLNAEVADVRVEQIGFFKDTALAIASIRGKFTLEFLPTSER